MNGPVCNDVAEERFVPFVRAAAPILILAVGVTQATRFRQKRVVAPRLQIGTFGLPKSKKRPENTTRFRNGMP